MKSSTHMHWNASTFGYVSLNTEIEPTKRNESQNSSKHKLRPYSTGGEREPLEAYTTLFVRCLGRKVERQIGNDQNDNSCGNVEAKLQGHTHTHI